MPTIVFASSKGGVGKTTSALALSFVLAHQKVQTTLIDADPNSPIVNWATRFPEGVPNSLTVIGAVGEDATGEAIDNARDPFIVVDLEGAKNVEVSVAFGRADICLIPMRGSTLDADEAVNIIKFRNRQEKIWKKPIPYRAFFAMTSILVSRGMKDIIAQFAGLNIPMMKTQMVEREAFKVPFRLGGSIYDLNTAQVRNPKDAIENAEAFAKEIMAILVQEHKASEETANV